MSYSAEVLADSPLAYYRLGDASGTTMTDSSGNARHGTYQSSPSLGQPSLLSSTTDTSARLIGSGSGYAQALNATWMQPTTITVEAWVKPDGVTGTYEIINRGGNGAFSSALSFRFVIIDATLYVRVFVNNSATTAVAQSGNVLAAGVVSHIAFTYGGSTIRIYHNGVEVATAALSGTLNPGTAPLLIGTNSGTARWPGVMDEVALYGTALSATRISAHYAAGTGTGGGGGTSTLSLANTLPAFTSTLSLASYTNTTTANRANGRIRNGGFVDESEEPVEPMPANLVRAQRVVKAIAYPTPTLDDGRPT